MIPSAFVATPSSTTALGCNTPSSSLLGGATARRLQTLITPPLGRTQRPVSMSASNQQNMFGHGRLISLNPTRSRQLNTSLMAHPPGKETPKDNVPEDIIRPPSTLTWDNNKAMLAENFGFTEEQLKAYETLPTETLLEAHEMMEMSRQFENACQKSYQMGKIAGFMHLNNGQESIDALIKHKVRSGDIGCGFYREHTQALAFGVDPGKVMAELFMKDTGTCRGAGGSMHIFDKENNFAGGWALVGEQIPYAAGMAEAIKLNQALGLTDPEQQNLSVLFLGEGAAQGGRLAETLNTASKEGLPMLFLIIDNGRAINTFTQDIGVQEDFDLLAKHYKVPYVKVNGQDAETTLKTGSAVFDYIREEGKPAILHVHTYRFHGHSPADPEHELGRKAEKAWARKEMDPIKRLSNDLVERELASKEALKEISDRVEKTIADAVKFADESPFPPAELAAELEYKDDPDTDYNLKELPEHLQGLSTKLLSEEQLSTITARIDGLRTLAQEGKITIADALNLAILEEMLRDPTTTMQAEDLRAGSSYNIPRDTQQTFGELRAADRIISEGHFVGLGIGQAMFGQRPIVEAMNTNFMIYGFPEISSAGNTYSTTGGQFTVPLTIVGAGGTAPKQSLGAEHSQPMHAYIMGIPGIKIITASDPNTAYQQMKSAIRCDDPVFFFNPVKMMKGVKGAIELDKCAPLKKATMLHKASDESISYNNGNKAVTVLTYLHGVKEAKDQIETIKAMGYDIDLIELNSLKPFDMETIGRSLDRTHKVLILDESTKHGGVGATLSAEINEQFYDKLDAPIYRAAMENAPVPYSDPMEKAVVKRGEDVVKGVEKLVNKQW